MYTLIAENQYGEQLELTHNNAYAIKSILGLDPPDAIINTSRNAGQDGSVYNSSFMDNRTVTITLAINYPVEKNRIQLYQFFKSKFPVILRYRNESRNVWIQGYVQSFQVAYFDRKETVQITILCPNPYLNDSETVLESLSNVVALFTFPFTIEEPIPMSTIVTGQEKSILNMGDMGIGIRIRITVSDTVVNPVILDDTHGTFMGFTDNLAEGDVIEIDTRSGHKSVKKISGGVTTSIISKLMEGSTWFILSPGDNVFSCDAYSGAVYMAVGFEVTYQYEGV